MAAALLALASLATSAKSTAADLGMWVWEPESAQLFKDRQAAAELIRFARRQQIHTLYVYADRFEGRHLLASQPVAWRRLLRQLHAEGFKVEALLGSGYLHTERYVYPEYRDTALAMFRTVFEFNAASSMPEERFDAIHFDIEPHLLPAWEDDRDGLLLAYLDLGRAIVSLRGSLGQDIPLVPDIPFWLDTIVLEWEGATRSVADHVIRLFDAVTLMDYRNQARGSDGIIAHAALEMDFAERAGRKVVIGVETDRGDPPKISFFTRTPTELAAELDTTEAVFRDNPAFAGFAIHHYASWKIWLGPGRK